MQILGKFKRLRWEIGVTLSLFKSLSKKKKLYIQKFQIKLLKKKMPSSIQKILPGHPFFFQIQILKMPYPYPTITYTNNYIQNKNHTYRMKKNTKKNITKQNKKKKKKNPTSVQNK